MGKIFLHLQTFQFKFREQKHQCPNLAQRQIISHWAWNNISKLNSLTVYVICYFLQVSKCDQVMLYKYVYSHRHVKEQAFTDNWLRRQCLWFSLEWKYSFPKLLLLLLAMYWPFRTSTPSQSEIFFSKLLLLLYSLLVCIYEPFRTSTYCLTNSCNTLVQFRCGVRPKYILVQFRLKFWFTHQLLLLPNLSCCYHHLRHHQQPRPVPVLPLLPLLDYHPLKVDTHKRLQSEPPAIFFLQRHHLMEPVRKHKWKINRRKGK